MRYLLSACFMVILAVAADAQERFSWHLEDATFEGSDRARIVYVLEAWDRSSVRYFDLVPGRGFHLEDVATDGGWIATASARGSIRLVPAEREQHGKVDRITLVVRAADPDHFSMRTRDPLLSVTGVYRSGAGEAVVVPVPVANRVRGGRR